MTNVGGVAAEQLTQYIERVERLEEEKATTAEHIRDVYAEAKGNGYDTKTIRKVVTLRKKEIHERNEEQELLDLYLHALGMIGQSSEAGDQSSDLAEAS